jgi:hypothetical protein
MPRRRLMTLREYSAYRRCTEAAVSQALRKGRLTEWSTRWDARRGCYRIDAARADWEWREHTHPDWGGVRVPWDPSRDRRRRRSGVPHPRAGSLR